MVIVEEDHVHKTQPRNINGTQAFQHFRQLSEQYANYSEEAFCSKADYTVGHPSSSPK